MQITFDNDETIDDRYWCIWKGTIEILLYGRFPSEPFDSSELIGLVELLDELMDAYKLTDRSEFIELLELFRLLFCSSALAGSA